VELKGSRADRPKEKRLSRLFGGGTFFHASFSFRPFEGGGVLVSGALFTGFENFEGFDFAVLVEEVSSVFPNDIPRKQQRDD
jgi:hypothetical protein